LIAVHSTKRKFNSFVQTLPLQNFLSGLQSNDSEQHQTKARTTMTTCDAIKHPVLADIESLENQTPEPGYDTWLREKVGATLQRVGNGKEELINHQDVLPLLAARMKVRLANSSNADSLGESSAG
jgi:hypothetical protein